MDSMQTVTDTASTWAMNDMDSMQTVTDTASTWAMNDMDSMQTVTDTASTWAMNAMVSTVMRVVLQAVGSFSLPTLMADR